MKLKNLLIIVSILLLFVASLLLYWKFNSPSDETIKREFLKQHSNAEFVSAEMIFDWEPKRVYSYLVEYKQPQSNEMLKDEFAIKQYWNFQWHWCSDQTERKCK